MARPAHWSAQRRPGPRPRRHIQAPELTRYLIDAQRRPGPRPRRHLALLSTKHEILPLTPSAMGNPSSLNEGRGRDPGDTRGCSSTPDSRQPLNEGRGRDPGDTCPQLWQPHGPTPLNEGRGRDPGDTFTLTTYYGAMGNPSSLNEGHDARTLNEGRGRDPGDTSRSVWQHRLNGRTLNEGRGRDPGDTTHRA